MLSLALFVLSVLMVGAAVNSSLRASTKLERQTRGLMLAESVLARIRAGQIAASDNADGDFMPQFPGYSYRLAVSDVEQMEELQAVTVTVSWPMLPGGQSDAVDSLSLTSWQYQPAPPEPVEEEPVDDSSSQPPSDGGGGGRP